MQKIKLILNGREEDINKYNIIIKESKGEFKTTSSNMSFTCYTNQNRKVIIASKFNWKRIDKNNQQEIIPIHTNYYQLNPNDLDKYIQCEIQPIEDENFGKCIVQIGPFKLHQKTLQKLQNNNNTKIRVQGTYRNQRFQLIEINDQKMLLKDHNLLFIDSISLRNKINVVNDYIDDKTLKIIIQDNQIMQVKFFSTQDRDLLQVLLLQQQNTTQNEIQQKSNYQQIKDLRNLVQQNPAFTTREKTMAFQILNFQGKLTKEQWYELKQSIQDNYLLTNQEKDDLINLLKDILNKKIKRQNYSQNSLNQSQFNESYNNTSYRQIISMKDSNMFKKRSSRIYQDITSNIQKSQDKNNINLGQSYMIKFAQSQEKNELDSMDERDLFANKINTQHGLNSNDCDMEIFELSKQSFYKQKEQNNLKQILQKANKQISEEQMKQEIEKLQNKLNRMLQEDESKDKRIQLLNNRLKDLEEENQKFYDNFQDRQIQNNEQYTSKLEQYKTQINQLEKENQQLIQKMDDLEQQSIIKDEKLNTLNEELTRESELKEIYLEENDVYLGQIKILEDEINLNKENSVQNKFQEVQQIGMQKENLKYQTQIKSLKKQIQESKQNLIEQKDLNDQLQNKLQNKKKVLNNLQKNLDEQEQNYKNLYDRFIYISQQFKEKQQIEQQYDMQKFQQNDNEKFELENAKLKQKLKIFQKDFENAQRENSNLQNKLRSYQIKIKDQQEVQLAKENQQQIFLQKQQVENDQNLKDIIQQKKQFEIEIKELQNQNSLLQQELQFKQQQTENLNDQLQQSQKKNKNKLLKSSKINIENRQLQNHIEQLQNQLKDQESQNNDVFLQNDEIQSKLRNDIYQLREIKLQNEQKINELQQMIQDQNNQINILDDELRKKENQLLEALQNEQNIQKENHQIKQLVDQRHSEKKQIQNIKEKQIEQKQEEIEQLQQQIRKLKNENEGLNDEISNLKLTQQVNEKKHDMQQKFHESNKILEEQQIQNLILQNKQYKIDQEEMLQEIQNLQDQIDILEHKNHQLLSPYNNGKKLQVDNFQNIISQSIDLQSVKDSLQENTSNKEKKKNQQKNNLFQESSINIKQPTTFKENQLQAEVLQQELEFKTQENQKLLIQNEQLCEIVQKFQGQDIQQNDGKYNEVELLKKEIKELQQENLDLKNLFDDDIDTEQIQVDLDLALNENEYLKEEIKIKQEEINFFTAKLLQESKDQQIIDVQQLNDLIQKKENHIQNLKQYIQNSRSNQDSQKREIFENIQKQDQEIQEFQDQELYKKQHEQLQQEINRLHQLNDDLYQNNKLLKEQMKLLEKEIPHPSQQYSIDDSENISRLLQRINDQDEDQTKIRDYFLQILKLLDENKLQTVQDKNLKQIVHLINQSIKDIKQKMQDFEDQEQFVNKANEMMMNYELENKAKDEQIQELIKEKEILMNNLYENNQQNYKLIIVRESYQINLILIFIITYFRIENNDSKALTQNLLNTLVVVNCQCLFHI